ncbi:uncharacterized protein LOC143229670 isoform X2 [Tachypleus tridentatus]|uniref:uncharacterized protein LOC143229670 isoform X2 n=1 Tax=Tachypleus tridentatus TaxID=6853 RepID=UPI003FD4042B
MIDLTTCYRRTIKTGHCYCDNVGKTKTQSSCSRKYLSLWFHSWFWFVVILSLATPGIFVNGNCQYPATWSGSWFQKGVQDPILIYNGTLSSKGVCRQMSGDKFLIESRTESCYRCVVIHEKHINVLQYKETYCSLPSEQPRLEDLCLQISGDALLYSMFRLETPPVPCPFRGSFTFTYSRGHGECDYPVSTADPCTDESRMLFKFKACASVITSESREEKLTCLASWKEGSTRYLVGKMEHKGTKTDDDKFRCFVYDRMQDNTGFRIAQSGDATCDGLFSAVEGSRTMKLTRIRHPHGKCHFPSWISAADRWRTLDTSWTYVFSDPNTSFHVYNSTSEELQTRAVCNSVDQATEDATRFVVQTTSLCKTGFVCMKVHRRTQQIMEIQQGLMTSRSFEACTSVYFDSRTSLFTTLTSSAPSTGECPLVGRYMIHSPQSQMAKFVSDGLEDDVCSEHLESGCRAIDRLDFLSECSSERIAKSFQCHGSWKENGTYYLIASALRTRRRYCIVYAVIPMAPLVMLGFYYWC